LASVVVFLLLKQKGAAAFLDPNLAFVSRERTGKIFDGFLFILDIYLKN
jgi:hypothetical protein